MKWLALALLASGCDFFLGGGHGDDFMIIDDAGFFPDAPTLPPMLEVTGLETFPSDTYVGLSTTSFISVRNVGGLFSGPVTTALTGAAYTLTNGCGALPPATMCSIRMTFAPTQIGTNVGTLVIAADPGDRLGFNFHGTGLPNALAAMPATLDFGCQTAGTTSAPRQATITNTSATDVAGAFIQLDNPLFAIQSDTCSGATIPPAGTCTIALTYTPPAIETDAGNLEVLVTTGIATIHVQGMGCP